MFKGVALVAVLLLLAFGLWLDGRTTLEQWPLFMAFQSASLAGAALAVAWLWPRLPGVARRTILIVAALIIWRVSYFPIMVWAGWVTTLADWLVVQTGLLPSTIYPLFLLTVALMNSAAIITGALAVEHKSRVVLPLLSLAFIVAAMVSFTSKDDLTLLPDNNIAIHQSPPLAKPPVENSYFAVLDRADYNAAEWVLIFASASMYSAIPPTPWSTIVKGVLEEEFRAEPKASSAERVREHYLAFRSAHRYMKCGSDC
ncbi:MAG: hypothetical protein GXP10_01250 [Gammaproteobacteria bacterium]|nr:hypothetical protein [Gammaproteobacteria bacterium]